MKVGSLVECINDSGFIFFYKERTPVRDEIYTVRDIYDSYCIVGIRLEEIRNPIHKYSDGFDECGFKIERFREVQPPMDLTELLEETILEPVKRQETI